MKVDKPFEGHFAEDDLRDLLWGQQGCKWPTIPPMKWRVWAESAHTHLVGLLYPGLLFSWFPPAGRNNPVVWLATIKPPGFGTCVLSKVQPGNDQFVQYRLQIRHNEAVGVADKIMYLAWNHKCNDDRWFASISFPNWLDGEATGVKAYQCFDNATMPPGHDE